MKPPGMSPEALKAKYSHTETHMTDNRSHSPASRVVSLVKMVYIVSYMRKKNNKVKNKTKTLTNTSHNSEKSRVSSQAHLFQILQ